MLSRLSQLKFYALVLIHFKLCESACPPLIPNRGIAVECKIFGQIQNCSTPSKPLTTADYRCEKFYRPLFIVEPIQLRCEENGVWSNFWNFQEYICETDCGKAVRPHNPFITFAHDTDRYSWPWHATIFVQNSKTKEFDYKCGGSLINSRMVLTAAHCISRPHNFPLHSFRIALGAISSNWTENQDDKLVQIFKVKEKGIHVPEEYLHSNDLRSDIGLLELDHPVMLSDAVSPVCFPYDQDDNKPDRPEVIGHGEVVGYGNDENGDLQLHLRYAKLPIVSTADCAKVLERGPEVEQFCAGIIYGTSVCNGDSGGGMVFKNHGAKRYYVQGIVSSGDERSNAQCTKGLAYFTNVLHFSRWVSLAMVNPVPAPPVLGSMAPPVSVVPPVSMVPPREANPFLDCPSGWTVFKDTKCFKLFHKRLTQEEAKQECDKNYSKLASVHSEEELIFLIQRFIPRVFLDFVWIGGIKEEGKWQWRDGTEFDYFNWFPGHPDFNKCVGLVTMSFFLGYGKMITSPCNSLRIFICQKQNDSVPV